MEQNQTSNPFFSIIIPNYNNENYLDNLFTSIKKQDFDNYEIIFIDDMSTDNSIIKAKEWMPVFNNKLKIIPLIKKKYNGGTRNIGLKMRNKFSKYTLFIDSDDNFSDTYCLSTIVKIINENNNPDCIRLSYNWCGDENRTVKLVQNTIEELANACDVACWTKCIKSELIVEFPENTLMEDATQHLMQLDKIDTIASCEKPIVDWNRRNPNSCSTNAELQNKKWISSLYRFYADLLDLQVSNPIIIKEKEKRIKAVKEAIKETLR